MQNMHRFRIYPSIPILTFERFEKEWVIPSATHDEEGTPYTEAQIKLKEYNSRRMGVRRWAKSRTNIHLLIEEGIEKCETTFFLEGLIVMRAEFTKWCFENGKMIEYQRHIDVISNEFLRDFCNKGVDAFKVQNQGVYNLLKKFSTIPQPLGEVQTILSSRPAKNKPKPQSV